MSKNIEFISYEVFDETAWYDNQSDGYVIIRDDILYKYKGEELNGLIIEVLPQEIKYIAGGAFIYNQDLISITLSDVQILGDFIFTYCNSLTEVNLINITELPESCFSLCYNLEKITLSYNITMIGIRAFHYCTSLKEAKFVVTSGWVLYNEYYRNVSDLIEFTYGSPIESSLLEEPKIAAMLLTKNSNCIWQRIEE